jgi:hypothetical protein
VDGGCDGKETERERGEERERRDEMGKKDPNCVCYSTLN